MLRSKIIKTILLVFSMITGLAIALTIAFFTTTDMATNQFKSQHLDILLAEPLWNPKKANNVVPDQYLPKNPLIKNTGDCDAYVFLTVTIPYVDGVELEDADGKKILNGEELFMQKEIFDYYIGNPNNYTKKYNDANWYELTSYRSVDADFQTITHCYAYVQNNGENYEMRTLAVNGSTETLFDAVRMINLPEKQGVEPNYIYESGRSVDELSYTPSRYSIDIKAYGIQTKYLIEEGNLTDPESVWAFYLNHIGD